MDTFWCAGETWTSAVNTPADELLQCGKPGRTGLFLPVTGTAKQGMLNVDRVGTTQTPNINITVLKGTYASSFDPTAKVPAGAHYSGGCALPRARGRCQYGHERKLFIGASTWRQNTNFWWRRAGRLRPI
ncbi:MAG: hypothetical protein IPH00_16875 [Flavobacteriales bacterium]|nr:hypothetical protein [Flavobacteriales bacterium]